MLALSSRRSSCSAQTSSALKSCYGFAAPGEAADAVALSAPRLVCEKSNVAVDLWFSRILNNVNGF